MLNTVEIKNLLASDKRTKTSFRGVFASDELPLKAPTSSLYVCNTDPSSQPGKHWIVIYTDSKKRAEFFDSFGVHPSVRGFETFLENNSLRWTHNIIKLYNIHSLMLVDIIVYFFLFIAVWVLT